ncbi:MAG: Protease Do [Candidatus Berkelbacteria bacterium Licking1014_96]|uniref:Protease Do n=1 Tax=Candidatus Berkelbacteria bacterium Licking1014_96 TaxID=2017149 RepID=A0A554LDI9_9BACT|nr:MAG: Protease Do [Candidatus Berkelbacteria bacterium Licking1014_96]
MENIKIQEEGKEAIPFGAKKEGIGFKGVVLIIILSLVFGIIGGGGGVYLLLTKGGNLLKTFLKDQSGSIPTTVTQKLKLEESSKVIDAVEKVSPSVVSIIATAEVPGFFNTTSTERSAGTGFIVTSDGLVMTNKHVVANSSAKYMVYLNTGKSYAATIQATDPFNDLAIIKIEAKDLPVVDFGNPDDMKNGQIVIAIGNALGEFQNTVTTGILSAKERTITATDASGLSQEKLEGLLQTDAAINSGNSGGPLLNLEGQVIGINVAVAQQAENIGFAIPSTLAQSAMESIKRTGKIIRPYMGVRYVSLNPEVSKTNNISVDYGAYIYTMTLSQPAVVPGSPADQAGIKQGDIITAINAEKIDATHSLTRLMQKYQPDDEIEITYLRNGQENKVKIKLSSTDKAGI